MIEQLMSIDDTEKSRYTELIWTTPIWISEFFGIVKLKSNIS